MKKVLSVILALMLMMQMLATFTLAAPEGEEDLILRATSVEGVVGDKVSMKLFVDNNSTGFAGIEVKALFNKAVLKLISIEFSAAVLEKFALAQASVIDDCNASGSAALAFLSVDSNTTDDIEVATLTFEILSDTPSVEVIELVDYAASFAVDANYNLVNIPMETSSGKITIKEKPVGVTVSGTVTSFNSDTDDVTVALYDGVAADPVYTATVKGNSASYSIDAVAAGTYTMKVSKKNHVTREYAVTVGETAVTQDAKIHLKGDINGDGEIKSADSTLMMRHIRGTKLLTGYQAQCADINGDGSIKSGDSTLMMRHIRGTKFLW